MNLVEIAVALTLLAASAASQLEYVQAVQTLGNQLQAKQAQVDQAHHDYLAACRAAAGLPPTAAPP